MKNSSVTKYESDKFSFHYANTVNLSSDISSHTKANWEFLYIKNGDLSYVVNGSVFDVAPGSLIITRPGTVHTLRPKGTIHYESYSLQVLESFLPDDFLMALSPDLSVLDVSHNNIILSLFEKTSFYQSRLSVAPLKRVMLALANEVLVNIQLCAQAPTQAVASYSNSVVTKAIYYIRDHIREPLTVKAISDALFISPSHLHHCFVKHMNVTPKEYVMIQKLQMVQRALQNTANPTDVCQYYGFRTYSTFYRNYQKIYGCRPSDSPPPSLKSIVL